MRYYKSSYMKDRSSGKMTLINFTKEELQKIEYYLLGETDPVVVSILEKIDALSNICECNNQS